MYIIDVTYSESMIPLAILAHGAGLDMYGERLHMQQYAHATTCGNMRIVLHATYYMHMRQNAATCMRM